MGPQPGCVTVPNSVLTVHIGESVGTTLRRTVPNCPNPALGPPVLHILDKAGINRFERFEQE